MIGQGRRIESDLFDVAARIREIDAGYFVMYSYRKHRYEVHNARQRGNTLCLVLPYPELDERAVRLVRKTRVERLDELMRSLEVENAKREKEKMRAMVKRSEAEFSRLMSKQGA